MTACCCKAFCEAPDSPHCARTAAQQPPQTSTVPPGEGTSSRTNSVEDKETLDKALKLLQIARFASGKLRACRRDGESTYKSEIDELLRVEDEFFPAMKALRALAARSAGEIPTGRSSAPQGETYRNTREGLERSATQLREQVQEDKRRIFGKGNTSD